MTQKEFINKARQVHGAKYDYSKTQFRTTKKKVLIVCPKHGEFYQLANNHLHGYGCVKCAQNNVPQYGRRRVIFGVGINDSVKAISKGRTRDDCDYYTWHGMIQRCYDKKFQEKILLIQAVQYVMNGRLSATFKNGLPTLPMGIKKATI